MAEKTILPTVDNNRDEKGSYTWITNDEFRWREVQSFYEFFRKKYSNHFTFVDVDEEGNDLFPEWVSKKLFTTAFDNIGVGVAALYIVAGVIVDVLQVMAPKCDVSGKVVSGTGFQTRNHIYEKPIEGIPLTRENAIFFNYHPNSTKISGIDEFRSYAENHGLYRLVLRENVKLSNYKIQETTVSTKQSSTSPLQNALDNVKQIVNEPMSFKPVSRNESSLTNNAGLDALSSFKRYDTSSTQFGQPIMLGEVDDMIDSNLKSASELLGYRTNIDFKKERNVMGDLDNTDISFYITEKDRESTVRRFIKDYENFYGRELEVINNVETRVQENKNKALQQAGRSQETMNEDVSILDKIKNVFKKKTGEVNNEKETEKQNN